MRARSSEDTISLTAGLTDSQAERAQQQLTGDALDVMYQEEQHGLDLIVHIQCSPAQENTVRKILQDLGIVTR